MLSLTSQEQRNIYVTVGLLLWLHPQTDASFSQKKLQILHVEPVTLEAILYIRRHTRWVHRDGPVVPALRVRRALIGRVGPRQRERGRAGRSPRRRRRHHAGRQRGRVVRAGAADAEKWHAGLGGRLLAGNLRAAEARLEEVGKVRQQLVAAHELQGKAKVPVEARGRERVVREGEVAVVDGRGREHVHKGRDRHAGVHVGVGLVAEYVLDAGGLAGHRGRDRGWHESHAVPGRRFVGRFVLHGPGAGFADEREARGEGVSQTACEVALAGKNVGADELFAKGEHHGAHVFNGTFELPHSLLEVGRL